MEKGTIDVAVVGMGKMGLLHASILNSIPNVRVAAFCEKSFVMSVILKKILRGIRTVREVHRLSDLDLDAVYITTPISAHFQVANDVYTLGIARNLFVEKTLASTYEESKRLCELTDRYDGVNMVGYVRRFEVTFKKAYNMLSQNMIGSVSLFSAYAYSSDFLSERCLEASTRRDDVLRDLGCHALDLALWFFGDLKVDLVQTEASEEPVSENSVHLRVQNAYGLAGEFNFSRCKRGYRTPEVGFSIRGSKGSIDVNDDRLVLKRKSGKSSVWYRHDLHDNVAFSLGQPEFFREDYSFIESLIHGGNAEPDFRTASKVDLILDQIKEADGNKG